MTISPRQIHQAIELSYEARMLADPDPDPPSPRSLHLGAWRPPTRAEMMGTPALPPPPVRVVRHAIPHAKHAESAMWARSARLALVMTQDRIAAAVGVSCSSWCYYEQGVNGVPERIQRAVEALLDGAPAPPLPRRPSGTKSGRESAMQAGPELMTLVEEVLLRTGLSAERLSRKLGGADGLVGAWRRGHRGIGPAYLAALRALLGSGI